VAILETIVVLIVGSVTGDALAAALLPVTAGGFVYLAAADLIPELQEDRSFRGLMAQVGLASLGIALMVVLKLLD
jgi:zinc transporter ZupT